MELALSEARAAAKRQEVPIGAVLVMDGRVIARSGNRTRELNDVTAHAEIAVIRMACEALEQERLPGADLYVTLEPCTMCAGAMVHARIAQLVFGASEPRAGVLGSNGALLDEPWFNHRVSWQGGVLAEESGVRLQAFFQARR